MQSDVTGIFFKCDLCDWLVSANMIAATDMEMALQKHMKKIHKVESK